MARRTLIERLTDADAAGEHVDWESIAEDQAEARPHHDYDY